MAELATQLVLGADKPSSALLVLNGTGSSLGPFEGMFFRASLEFMVNLGTSLISAIASYWKEAKNMQEMPQEHGRYSHIIFLFNDLHLFLKSKSFSVHGTLQLNF